jgi:hypothetical protein
VLRITVPGVEHFDEENSEFITKGDYVLELEHSLVTLSKWESITERPFLAEGKKTAEDVMSYIRVMVQTPDVPPVVFDRLSQENIDDINKYIAAKMSATWFSTVPNAPKTKETITSELIYYWMTVFNIPWEAQYWHLSRLFTLIKVCNEKNAKPKKMSRAETVARNRKLNEERKQQFKTRG